MNDELQKVVVTASPNKTYHGHTGDLIRYLTEMDGTLNVEIRWDRPYPISETSRQVMRAEYLTTLDGQALVPNVIQEET